MKISVKTKTPRPFRRAGVEFGPAPVELDADELGPERLAAIRAEEMLEVVDLQVPRAAVAPAVHEPAYVHAESDEGGHDAPSGKRKGKR